MRDVVLQERTSVHSVIHGEWEPVNWVIPDFIPQGQLLAAAGLPGVGKSQLFYHIALAVASGTDFLGWMLPTAQKVVYFDQENGRQDHYQYIRRAYNGQRLNALKLERNLFFYSFGLTQDWKREMFAYVEKHQPALVIVDTATSAFDTRDENDNAEAAQQITHLRHVQKLVEPNVAIVVLRHLRESHKGVRSMRGAKTWKGMVDSTVFIQRSGGRPRSDGLCDLVLVKDKTRAFGLQEDLKIIATWDDHGAGLAEGLELTRG